MTHEATNYDEPHEDSESIEFDESWSRHHRGRAGAELFDAISLTSYDQQTIWGYDTGTNGFFAQLWSNGTRTDNPELWLSAPMPLLHPECLVPPIVEHTGHDPLPVMNALGIAHRAPKLRASDDLDQYAAQRAPTSTNQAPSATA